MAGKLWFLWKPQWLPVVCRLCVSGNGTLFRSHPLCAVAKEARKFRKNWQRNHRRCLSVFGDHIGSDVEDIFIEWSQNFDQLSYKLSFDRVRSGIQTKNYPQFDFTYSGEIGYQIEPNTKITLRYAYEDINNYCNIQDERQRNYFLGVDLAFHF